MSDPAISPTQVEAALRAVSLSQGFNAWLNFDLVRVGHGDIELTLALRPDLIQHHGFAHGGVVGALADTACSWAAASVGGDVVTSSYTIHFLAPAKGDRLRVTAQVIKAGKRQVTVEAKVFAEGKDSPPKLAAIALASITVVGVLAGA